MIFQEKSDSTAIEGYTYGCPGDFKEISFLNLWYESSFEFFNVKLQ